MNWLDLLLILFIGVLTGFAAQRKTSGFLVGLGGVILLRPILYLASINLMLAIGVGIISGFVLGLMGRLLSRRLARQNMVMTILGGVGGFLLGSVLVLAFSTSLPYEVSQGYINYPPSSIPAPFDQGAQSSRFVSLGSDILLYPLFQPEQLESKGYGVNGQAILRNLHSYLVFTRPWEGSGG